MTEPTTATKPLHDLTPELQTALRPYLPRRVPEPGTEARATLLAEVSDQIEAAWRATVEADEAGAFVDLPMARRLREALTRALAVAQELPTDLVTPLIGAARYFAETDDDSDDFASQWGFDDDRDVVDAVITLLNSRADLSLKRTGNVIRAPRPSRAGAPKGRKLPRVDNLTRDLLLRHHPDLGEVLYETADHVIDHARRDGLDATIADIRERMAAHVAAVEEANEREGIQDVQSAHQLAFTLEALIAAHEEATPLNDRVLPLVLAAAEVFIASDDAADDLEGPFGFDDDRKVVDALQAFIETVRKEA